MDTFAGFVAVVIVTIAALFGALALQALLLRATLALMQPAAAPRKIARPSSIEPGTRLAAHAFAKAR
jgi:hypothetical protein